MITSINLVNTQKRYVLGNARTITKDVCLTGSVKDFNSGVGVGAVLSFAVPFIGLSFTFLFFSDSDVGFSTVGVNDGQVVCDTVDSQV